MKKISLFLSLTVLQITAAPDMIKDRQGAKNPSHWTFITPLVAAVINTQGAVLELGCGEYSTPLLHALCSADKRSVFTVDADVERINSFQEFGTSWHQMQCLSLSTKNSIKKRHWAVVFINKNIRKKYQDDLKKLYSNTDIFVIHDSNDIELDIVKQFTYHYIYDRYNNHTLLLSNTINVEQLFNN